MQKIILIFFLVYPNLAYAYLGPGVGFGILAATVGIVVAIFAALFGILWYPIKKIIKKRKERKDEINKSL
tara:strand:+ start:1248 stop:1457 length:210 start_codon:yes stop_codon:yes gene_type:complete